MEASPASSGLEKPGLNAQDEATIARIQALLKAKDDTQRFVGLALLKSALDDSEPLRKDAQVIQALWSSISAKFLDRLLRTGTNPSKENAKEMLDLVVSVLHTFVLLLPDEERSQPKFIDRIPGLVNAVLYSLGDVTERLLQVLHALSSVSTGAAALINIEDLSPLTEIAPSHAAALDVLLFAWLNGMSSSVSRDTLRVQISRTIQGLVVSFKGTDGVTLLEFLGSFLRQADTEVLPQTPQWLSTVVASVQKLVISRPTPEARSAYTNAAASLLESYPQESSGLLFRESEKADDNPFAYLLINLLLIDIRSSTPMLMEQLNAPDYSKTSRRLASAFDVVYVFIGYLVRSLDDNSSTPLFMAPDSLLKLRKSISETMAVTVEYLRDRWDATFAGAMGLHPDARSSTTTTSTGTHYTLTWDSLKSNADEDPLILSAVRASAFWLREDANELLMKEASGLIDMYLDLYGSSATEKLDFRAPVLMALEALVNLERGRDILLKNGGWVTLSHDLTNIMQLSRAISEREATRGTDIVRVLLSLIEQEGGTTAEAHMNLITSVAAWDVPESVTNAVVQEFALAILQLCCTLLEGALPGMRQRYAHSISAIHGIAKRLSDTIPPNEPLRDSMDDVLGVLRNLS